MRWRNGEHGYGIVTKALHWSTVALLAAQFTVGYVMETKVEAPDADCDPPGAERGGGDTSEAEERRLDRLEERCEETQDLREDGAADAVGVAWSELWSGGSPDGGLSLPGWHVVLGLTILVLGVARMVWRRTTPLPPWDPRLTGTDRTVLHWTERILLALLLVVPVTGILLVVGSDDLVGVHVAAQLCFLAALGVHVTVVLRRGVVGRMLRARGGPARGGAGSP